MGQLTQADRDAQATQALFLFWRADNEREFLFACVLVDVRIVLQIGGWGV